MGVLPKTLTLNKKEKKENFFIFYAHRGPRYQSFTPGMLNKLIPTMLITCYTSKITNDALMKCFD